MLVPDGRGSQNKIAGLASLLPRTTAMSRQAVDLASSPTSPRPAAERSAAGLTSPSGSPEGRRSGAVTDDHVESTGNDVVCDGRLSRPPCPIAFEGPVPSWPIYAGLMTREEIKKEFANEGLSPHSWSNSANYFYQAHSHDYDKVLYCVQGEVTFHLEDGDVLLRPGQRVDIPAGTRHAATVGPDGVECMEAAIRHR